MNIRYIKITFFMVMALMPFTVCALDIKDVIKEVRMKYVPDSRQDIFDVKCVEKQGNVVIEGVTTRADAKEALIGMLDGINFVDSIKILRSDCWAQVSVPVACFRTNPGHSKELATQAVMGHPVCLLEKQGEWYRARTLDGYIAWVIDNSLTLKTEKQMDEWRKSKRFVITAPHQVYAYVRPGGNGLREIVTELVNGSIVKGEVTKDGGYIMVTLPDGRKGWIESDAAIPADIWANQDFNPGLILDLAYSMEGSPYLWGGTSTKSLDCSGLSKVSYFANGRILMRDASQQARNGQKIEAKDWRTCKAGDLLFFGNAKTRSVTHVAIYDNNGNYVHSSGRVKRNSLDSESNLYLDIYLLQAVRIDGSEGKPGITLAIKHPWLFEVNNR
jgi:cell wall-associated NlpC family hydrolase